MNICDDLLSETRRCMCPNLYQIDSETDDNNKVNKIYFTEIYRNGNNFYTIAMRNFNVCDQLKIFQQISTQNVTFE